MTFTEKLDLFEKLAKEATPGPWRMHECNGLHDGPAVDTLSGEYVCTTAEEAVEGLHDAAYIAALNPAAVLELIHACRVMEESLVAIAHYGIPYTAEECRFEECRLSARTALAAVNQENKKEA
jgi:hypothetical protein